MKPAFKRVLIIEDEAPLRRVIAAGKAPEREVLVRRRRF